MSLFDRNHPELIRISAQATSADVVAARRFQAVERAHGYLAAFETASATHLVRKFNLGRGLGIVVRRILADHVPTLPHERQYQESCARVGARWRRGHITEQEHNEAVARLRKLRDERAEAWYRFDVDEARRRYRKLTQAQKTRERLRFRATRPRT